MALLERAAELGAIGATISGAGPTVLFWTQADTTGAVAGRLRGEAEGWADVIRAPFEPRGRGRARAVDGRARLRAGSAPACRA